MLSHLARGRAQHRQAVTVATHVLHWVPAWMAPGGGGFWKLQSFEAFITGLTSAGTYEPGRLGRITGQDTLARWAAAQLGGPVLLTYTEIVLRGSAPGPRWRERCPFYWVTPAHLLAPLGGRS